MTSVRTRKLDSAPRTVVFTEVAVPVRKGKKRRIIEHPRGAIYFKTHTMQLVYLRATAAVLVVISQLAVAKRYPVSSSYGVMDEVDDVQDIAQGEIRKIRSNFESQPPLSIVCCSCFIESCL